MPESEESGAIGGHNRIPRRDVGPLVKIANFEPHPKNVFFVGKLHARTRCGASATEQRRTLWSFKPISEMFFKLFRLSRSPESLFLIL